VFKTIEDYHRFAGNLKTEPADIQYQICRHLAKTDLFFLLWFVCGRADIAKPWLLERCREVQDNPDGYLDLWAREHYKSTIITFGKTIQDILQNPNLTVGIFSHTRPNAKSFLKQIKRELETNDLLKHLFSEVLFSDPRKESPKWSEDEGLVVKRTENPKESTIEAWGLVDGQPTGKHFKIRIYDDVVVPESVTTPDMIQKTTDAWAMSNNLGAQGGSCRHIGTRYHFNDTYREILARGAAKQRIYAATEDGTPDGEPVLLTKEILADKRRTQGSYIFASQMLQNPKADETSGFRREWLRWHKGTDGSGLNVYMICDPANEKKKTNDFTCILVIGLGADRNYYLLDAIRDRLSLTQRADHIFRMHKKWLPMTVGYEKYGMQADIEHLKDRMGRENYHFNVTELGGNAANRKNDSIRKLIPIYENGRFWLPQSLFRTLYDGRTVDIIDQFLSEEYDAFPVPVHDDMLDCMARIVDQDLNANFPRLYNDGKKDAYSGDSEERYSAWGA
jgi:phage terminase large subunit-like protein